MPAAAEFDETEEIKGLQKKEIINVSEFLQANGQFVWDAPEGDWTIVRMGIRIIGASTRPSPEPVIGLESDKLNAEAFENHLKNFTDILLEKTSPRKEGVGWTGFHIDNGITTIPLEFFPYESFFIVFDTGKTGKSSSKQGKGNFPVFTKLMTG